MGKSLLKEISELSQPVTDFDIEDDGLREPVFSDEEETEAKEAADDHYVSVSKSKLRQQNEGLKLGSKYSGSVTSRSDLYQDDEQDSEEDDDSEEEEEQEEDVENDESEEEVDLDNVESDESGESELESEGSESESDTELDHQRSKLKQLITSERKHIVNRLSQSATNDSLKGYAIQQQHKFFDKLIDCRLKFQKSLQYSNQLPVDVDSLQSIEEKLSKKKLKAAKESCYDLLDSIFSLRNELLKSDGISASSIDVPRKRTFSEYHKCTSSFDKRIEPYRHQVLIKWSAKVQNSSGSTALNSGKFKAINQSFDQQIENNLSDMDRLIKRTKLNRRQITPLGYEHYKSMHNDENQDDDNENEENIDIPKEVKPESGEIDQIFDDDDFYRVLLNDLVDKKIQSQNPTTGLAMINLKSAQKVQKMNKNVDTKASKGRKLRYTVQEPIANLEVPRQGWKWDDHQIDEFFASLLGQKVNMNETEEVPEEEEELTVDQDTIKLFG